MYASCTPDSFDVYEIQFPSGENLAPTPSLYGVARTAMESCLR